MTSTSFAQPTFESATRCSARELMERSTKRRSLQIGVISKRVNRNLPQRIRTTSRPKSYIRTRATSQGNCELEVRFRPGLLDCGISQRDGFRNMIILNRTYSFLHFQNVSHRSLRKPHDTEQFSLETAFFGSRTRNISLHKKTTV